MGLKRKSELTKKKGVGWCIGLCLWWGSGSVVMAAFDCSRSGIIYY